MFTMSGRTGTSCHFYCNSYRKGSLQMQSESESHSLSHTFCHQGFQPFISLTLGRTISICNKRLLLPTATNTLPPA